MTDYVVGYKKPPQHRQFKKGASGNPSGRPKSTLNVAEIFEKALKAQVTIEENGEKTNVTKMEAAVKRLVDKASSGDMNAFRVLAAFVQSSNDAAAASAAEGSDLKEADRKILEKMLLRFDTSTPEEANSENQS
jgi:hypothetical protein